MRHETQNLIPLGNLIIGNADEDKTDWRDPANWFMATVSDTNGILLTAIMAPPNNLALYATDNKIDSAVIDCLIHGIADRPVPGVVSEKGLAQCFAERYAASHNKAFEIAMSQCIYELTEVNPQTPQVGTLRLLDERDMPFFPFWYEAFYAVDTVEGPAATTMQIPTSETKYLYNLSKKYIYILEVDGIPVSMAGVIRELSTVCCIGPVYTPPYYRGKGYASSAVAQLSQLMLNKGFTKCALFTDLANPTSNRIYHKMGYRPFCDWLRVRFV